MYVPAMPNTFPAKPPAPAMLTTMLAPAEPAAAPCPCWPACKSKASFRSIRAEGSLFSEQFRASHPQSYAALEKLAMANPTSRIEHPSLRPQGVQVECACGGLCQAAGLTPEKLYQRVSRTGSGRDLFAEAHPAKFQAAKLAFERAHPG
jgi:hypothetical protein